MSPGVLTALARWAHPPQEHQVSGLEDVLAVKGITPVAAVWIETRKRKLIPSLNACQVPAPVFRRTITNSLACFNVVSISKLKRSRRDKRSSRKSSCVQT